MHELENLQTQEQESLRVLKETTKEDDEEGKNNLMKYAVIIGALTVAAGVIAFKAIKSKK